MNFHTPSLGEGFDLNGIEDEIATDTNHQTHLESFGSKRLQNIDHNLTISSGVNAANFNAYSGLNNTNNMSQTPATPTTLAARKQLLPGATDPNEPAKPLSAYAYFFRDTVSAIKQQNPDCNFEQLSSIVSSMWEVLDPVQKDVFFKKTDAARAEYIKQMRLYQQQLSQQQQNIIETSAKATTLQRPATANITEATPNILNNQYHIQTANHQFDQTKQINTDQNDPERKNVFEEKIGTDICIREGCNRSAVMNPDWEDEYCSNECVVVHCRNVFNLWVQQNKEQPPLTATENCQ